MSDRSTSRLARWAPLVLPLLIAAVVTWIRWPDSPPEPVDVTSTSPTFDTLEDLVAASDLVVIGVIEDAAVGRAISDPTDPTAGIRTTLYTLQIDTLLAGEAADRVTIEHETALLGGTPITIDGIEPPQVGERSLFFLIAGTTNEFPHHALIGSQGRYPINGSTIRSISNDPAQCDAQRENGGTCGSTSRCGAVTAWQQAGR